MNGTNKYRGVPLPPQGQTENGIITRTEAIGVFDFLVEDFNSTLLLKIFTYQKGISNPQYVPNIGIEIDPGNSE